MRWISLAFAVFLAPMAGAEPASYRLVFAEEFDDVGPPDPRVWSYDTEANASGWYNNEEQYYAVARPENSGVANGVLTITARAERLSDAPDYGDQSYSSARIITRGKAEWTYGFFEIRAKLPCGTGTWPAIWMLGAQGDWPGAGEIDIMEQVGADPDHIFGTIHSTATAGTSGDGGSARLADACRAFHRYQMHWTQDAITILIDDRPLHRVENQHRGRDQWPFDAPQYLLLNLAIGGDMAGPADPGVLPRSFEIDYVRVWQTPA